MLHLEKRFYTLVEIKKLMDSKRKETITNNLTQWNYRYEWIPYKGVNILETPEESGDALEQLKALLKSRLGLDKQTNFKAFAAMFYLFIEDDDFQTAPWEARAKELNRQFGIEISEKTLRTYMSKLLAQDIMIKDSEFREYWKTTYVCGIEKVQLPVTLDEEEAMWEYFNKRSQYLLDADILYQQAMDEPIGTLNPKRWNIALRKLWDEYKTVYYPVKGFQFNAFEDKDIQELYRLSSLVIADVDLSKEEVEEIIEERQAVSATSCIDKNGNFYF